MNVALNLYFLLTLPVKRAGHGHGFNVIKTSQTENEAKTVNDDETVSPWTSKVPKQ